MRVIDVEVESCQVLGRGGFSQLRRCQVRNLREDGSRSKRYTLDLVERPVGADAVAVVPFDPGPPVRVLLRRGLRPALRLARAGQPTREGDLPGIHLLEVVAGILELQDVGQGGLRRRAARELLEEVGIEVDPHQVQPLGPAVSLSPGLMPERIYLCQVSVDLDRPRLAPVGDGSPLEEGSETLLLPLDQALAQCSTGEIQDAKTELALRRLARHLEHNAQPRGASPERGVEHARGRAL